MDSTVKHTAKRTIRKKNCQPKIRITATDILGRTMTLTGRYAFEYSVVIETEHGMTCFTHPTRKEALADFNKRKAKKRK